MDQATCLHRLGRFQFGGLTPSKRGDPVERFSVRHGSRYGSLSVSCHGWQAEGAEHEALALEEQSRCAVMAGRRLRSNRLECSPSRLEVRSSMELEPCALLKNKFRRATCACCAPLSRTEWASTRLRGRIVFDLSRKGTENGPSPSCTGQMVAQDTQVAQRQRVGLCRCGRGSPKEDTGERGRRAESRTGVLLDDGAIMAARANWKDVLKSARCRAG
jgi:hypothetical protein